MFGSSFLRVIVRRFPFDEFLQRQFRLANEEIAFLVEERPGVDVKSDVMLGIGEQGVRQGQPEREVVRQRRGVTAQLEAAHLVWAKYWEKG